MTTFDFTPKPVHHYLSPSIGPYINKSLAVFTVDGGYFDEATGDYVVTSESVEPMMWDDAQELAQGLTEDAAQAYADDLEYEEEVDENKESHCPLVFRVRGIEK